MSKPIRIDRQGRQWAAWAAIRGFRPVEHTVRRGGCPEGGFHQCAAGHYLAHHFNPKTRFFESSSQLPSLLAAARWALRGS